VREKRVRRENRFTTDDNLKIDLNPRDSANRYEVLHPRVNQLLYKGEGDSLHRVVR